MKRENKVAVEDGSKGCVGAYKNNETNECSSRGSIRRLLHYTDQEYRYNERNGCQRGGVRGGKDKGDGGGCKDGKDGGGCLVMKEFTDKEKGKGRRQNKLLEAEVGAHDVLGGED